MRGISCVSEGNANDDITRPFNLLIKAVTVEEFRLPAGSKERKIVLAFTRTDKRLPLNKTQAKTLAKLLGDDAEQWTGSTIVLAPAVAPNRKPTIALGVPHDGTATQSGAQPAAAAPTQPPAEPLPACETGGQKDAVLPPQGADGCPDA